MPDTSGSLIRHAAHAACLFGCLVFGTARADAQRLLPEPAAGPSQSRGFLTRYDFQLAASKLGVDDERFGWDTHFGGVIDAFDFGRGRVSGAADYEVVLGTQFRAFDPNQAYYVLETSVSGWAKATEIAGVFHHVSRHLSDRAKRDPIAWNVAAARVMRRLEVGETIVAIRADLGAVVAHAGVDYRWTGNADVVVRHPVNARVGVFARAIGEVVGVDETVGRRDTQRGGRIEGGIRINGDGAALELFAGYEQRLDAEPRDQVPIRWALAGFRLVNR